MQKQTVWIALIVAAVFAGGLGAAEVKGQNDREFEEQIHKMRQQVKDLVEAGHKDQADRIEQAIGRLQEVARQRLDQERGDRPNPGEAKQRLAELTRSLGELKEQGRGDEAEHVARQIEEIRQHLERGVNEGRDQPKQKPNRELEERLAEVKRRIAELKEAGRHDEADRLAQEAREMMRRTQALQGGEVGERGVGLEQRLGHMREAAKRLHAAGLHDAADNVIRQAELLAARERADRPGNEPRRDEGQQLARRVEELSQALREIRQKMEGMDKQMQELRAEHRHFR